MAQPLFQAGLTRNVLMEVPMILLESKQRFGAVGQGLFYWGALRLGNFDGSSDRFTYVFDCGSSSNAVHLQREITLLLPQVPPSRPISLLMISHLDYDHVSGLDSLLLGTKVQTAVLPYLEPAERLLLMLSAPRGKEWYLDFLSSPSRFFLRDGKTETVVYVTRGESGDPILMPEGPEGILSNEPGFRLDLETMERDREIEASAQSTDPEEAKQALFRKDTKPLRLFPLWHFIFYVSPKPAAQLDKFCQLVDVAFPSSSLEDILRDQEKRKRLATQYRKAFRTTDLNHTCFACLHGPVIRGHIPWPAQVGPAWAFPPLVGWPLWPPFEPTVRWERYYDLIEHVLHHYAHLFEEGGLDSLPPEYTFLTGDLNVGQEWGRVEGRFRHYLQRVQTLQVPHHGARSSWVEAIPRDLWGALFVISAGLKNRFGHPHPEVLESLSDAALGGNVRLVNEVSPLADYRVFPLPTR